MNTKERAKHRQRLARAIEQAYPRELTAFVNYIGRNWKEESRYVLQERMLEYAKNNYSAHDDILSGQVAD